MNRSIKRIISLWSAVLMILNVMLPAGALSDGNEAVYQSELPVDFPEGALSPEAILGPGVNFGVIANKYKQKGHTETNFAVKQFEMDRRAIEIFIEDTDSIPFYIGELVNNTVFWNGQDTNIDFDIYINKDQTHKGFKQDDHKNPGPDIHDAPYIQYSDLDHATNVYGREKEEINAYVDYLLDYAENSSRILNGKTATCTPTFTSEWDKTIDLTAPGFPTSGTIYVDCRNMKNVMKQDGWTIIKYEDQTVVFNISDTNGTYLIKQLQVDVKNPDGSHKITVKSATSQKDQNKDHNRDVDTYILSRIVFNMYNFRGELQIDTAAGIFLAPNANVKQVNGAGAGWVVTRKTFDSPEIEFHFYRRIRPYDAHVETGVSITKRFVKQDGSQVSSSDLQKTFTFKIYRLDERTMEPTELFATAQGTAGTITFEKAFHISKADFRTESNGNISGWQTITRYYRIQEECNDSNIIPDDHYIYIRLTAQGHQQDVTMKLEKTTTPSNASSWTQISGTEANVGTFTNTKKADVTIEVEKVWVDANNHDNLRPTSVRVQLYEGSAPKGDPVTLNQSNNWYCKWENLEKEESDGTPIVYTVKELDSNGNSINNNNNLNDDYKVIYSTATTENGKKITITNTHNKKKTNIEVEKAWDDSDNNDGKRLGSIQVQLYEGTVTHGAPVTLNSANNWYYKWENLDKNAFGGVEIVYIVKELDVIGNPIENNGDLNDNYTVTYSTAATTIGSKTTVTNTHINEKTSATVKKVWDDANDQDGVRPETLSVDLMNGETKVTTVTLSEDNSWEETVENLEKFAAGTEIVYTWKEGSMPEGYSLTSTDKEGTITTLTNSRTTEKTSATVKKVWDDANDQDGIRPETLSVDLMNGETKVTTVTLSEDNNWEETVENLEKFAAGTEIVYTWKEGSMPEGYSLTDTSVNGTVTTLTNSYDVKHTEASVVKVWNDSEDHDGFRPATLTVTLLANGKATDKSVTLTSEDNWAKKTITGLDKYSGGQEITYSWAEGNMPEGYSLTDTSVNGTVTTLTNSYDVKHTEASVVKVWNDSEDHDGFRPATLTVTLLANGKARRRTRA
ncbi:Cna B-type domain-containing protein [Clostridiales bacterium]|nr:Cna B-type domain-containing protein [Clostridiales bacterium]